MRSSIQVAAVLTVAMLLTLTLWPAVEEFTYSASGDHLSATSIEEPFNELDELVPQLMADTPSAERVDTDGDGIYDPVERVIGTNPDDIDSDFDLLDDHYEALNGLDPLNADSNYDGYSDYYEVTNVRSLDADGDGLTNAWDPDNDNDGIMDGLDSSPYYLSSPSDSFTFDLITEGKPLFLEFQIRTVNPEHLLLVNHVWDWRDGDKYGTMKDLDNSKEDVQIVPTLVWTVESYFKIVNSAEGNCIEVDENGNVVLGTFDGVDSELWRLESSGTGFSELINKMTGLCLEVTGSSDGDFAPIGASNITGANNQLWTVEYMADGSAMLIVRHSGKALEMAANGMSVCQNATSYMQEQLWDIELVGDTLPSQSDVKEYGIANSYDSSYVPLYPVYEDGAIVALNGKMVYPASSPLELLATASLVWRVVGDTDFPAKSLMGSDGAFVSVEDDGAMVLNMTDPGDLRRLEWVELGSGSVALRTDNGMYVRVGNDGYLTASGTGIGSRESFIWESKGEGKIVLEAYNGAKVYHDFDGRLVAIPGSSSQETFTVQSYTDYIHEQTFLASYP
ncbi:MAG: RICIN domain-containing protein, partial [Methanomassiliicoccales archaeon]|nr:RICIN domain-containing protein [Methanomassiliicoccales archaeon]